MSPIRRITEKLPELHGRVDRGYRLAERHMLLRLHLEANDGDHMARLLDRLMYAFLPTDAMLQLRVTRDDGTVRQIDCALEGELDVQHSDRIGAGARVAVPLLAPDPTWYDPLFAGITNSVTLIDGPVTVPIDVTGTTWETQPIFDFEGPFDAGLTIESDLSSEVIEITTALPGSTVMQFSLRPGWKNTSFSARKFDATSFQAMTEFRIPSELEVQRLTANPSATGFNYTITAAGTDANSRVRIAYDKRYISL